MRLLVLFLLFSSAAKAQSWKVQTSGLDTNLRGLSVVQAPDRTGVPRSVVWVCGSNGVILRSLDEGVTWQQLHVTGGDTLDFRGIVAFDGNTAYVMSSGEGEKSRLYKTVDGGETWNLQYTNARKEFFLDSLACLSKTHCLALADPLDGKFLLLETNDGVDWSPLRSRDMPAARAGEAAFAASNACLLLSGDEIFFATGGLAARVFHSSDAGSTWTVTETPMAHGKASSGIFSIGRGDGKTLVVIGGDYQDPTRASGVAAYSRDGGQTWQLSTEQPGGYRSSVARVKDSLFMAVGPAGEDLSHDSAMHWKHMDSLNLNAVTFLDLRTGWAVGPRGTIVRFINQDGSGIR
jgi:photosystem II stability/assembly factor-like uncharacterized protein